MNEQPQQQPGDGEEELAPRVLHSVAETAYLLGGISTREVYHRLNAGDLEGVRIGRRRLVVGESLAAFVARLRERRRRVEEQAVPDHLLDVSQLAEFLGMSEKWIKRQVAARAIPHRRLGTSVRFAPEDVEQILADVREPVVQLPRPLHTLLTRTVGGG